MIPQPRVHRRLAAHAAIILRAARMGRLSGHETGQMPAGIPASACGATRTRMAVGMQARGHDGACA